PCAGAGFGDGLVGVKALVLPHGDADGGSACYGQADRSGPEGRIEQLAEVGEVDVWVEGPKVNAADVHVLEQAALGASAASRGEGGQAQTLPGCFARQPRGQYGYVAPGQVAVDLRISPLQHDFHLVSAGFRRLADARNERD